MVYVHVIYLASTVPSDACRLTSLLSALFSSLFSSLLFSLLFSSLFSRAIPLITSIWWWRARCTLFETWRPLSSTGNSTHIYTYTHTYTHTHNEYSYIYIYKCVYM